MVMKRKTYKNTNVQVNVEVSSKTIFKNGLKEVLYLVSSRYFLWSPYV